MRKLGEEGDRLFYCRLERVDEWVHHRCFSFSALDNATLDDRLQ